MEGLARRIKDTTLLAVAADVGSVRTNLGRDATGRTALLLRLTRLIQDSPTKAARTPVSLATSTEFAGMKGGFFTNNSPGRVSALCQNAQLAQELWVYTTRLLEDQPAAELAQLQ